MGVKWEIAARRKALKMKPINCRWDGGCTKVVTFRPEIIRFSTPTTSRTLNDLFHTTPSSFYMGETPERAMQYLTDLITDELCPEYRDGSRIYVSPFWTPLQPFDRNAKTEVYRGIHNADFSAESWRTRG